MFTATISKPKNVRIKKNVSQMDSLPIIPASIEQKQEGTLSSRITCSTIMQVLSSRSARATW